MVEISIQKIKKRHKYLMNLQGLIELTFNYGCMREAISKSCDMFILMCYLLVIVILYL